MQLRKIARHVGEIVNGFPLDDPNSRQGIIAMLRNYADAIHPWAVSTARNMLLDVSKRDELTWMELAAEMSRELRDELRSAPTGEIMRKLMDDQVGLIRSLPLDAAQRVHEMTIRGLEDSTRAREIAMEIARSGEVSMNRANLIARTEVARTASALTEARAKHIGSEGYIWRTAGDSDVRDSHRQMNGKFVRWDEPPTLSDGTVTHAGQIYNCRCYPEPVIPDEI